ncbi:MAG TPA: hypothetical protein VKB34_13410 [Povalibacter sp.]|nr:hypothetical protein [Povalibacter sp.]
MRSMTDLAPHFWWVLLLIALALVPTVAVFRRRMFERGYRKGEAKDPARVRRENEPDEWSRSR